MNNNSILCVIPARYSSTRLPAKPLIMVNDLPLVMWAYNNAVASKAFDKVCVATDDIRIRQQVEQYGGISYMTSEKHASGTDRIAEVAALHDYKYIVNLQGDEPTVPHEVLLAVADNMKKLDDNSLLTCVSNATIDDKDDPNVVKAVLNNKGEALYFSRLAIPCDRDGASLGVLTHWGIYGFTQKSLQLFCSLAQGDLEKREKLEQLRALENGMRIVCITTSKRSMGIDTPKDIDNFRKKVEGMA